MKTRLTVPVWRVRPGTVESWRACTWFATVSLSGVLLVAPARAWDATQGEGSPAAPQFRGVMAAASGTQGVSPAAPAEAGLPQRAPTRALPQDPDPVQLRVPADMTAEQLRGGHGLPLALSLFSGLLLTATLVLLFGLLARERWFAEAAPDSKPQPSRRSSPSHR